MLILGIGAVWFFSKIKIDTTNRHVHHREQPSAAVVRLAVNRNILFLLIVIKAFHIGTGFDKRFGLDQDKLTITAVSLIFTDASSDRTMANFLKVGHL